MMQDYKEINRCICCDVAECRHHANAQDYCTLQEIRVQKHEPHATQCKCTDCASFECKPVM